MPPDSPPPRSPDPAAPLAHWVRRRLVWLLVATYVAAAVAPGPGVWLRGLAPEAEGPAPIRFSLVLVGVLLFCGAASVDLGKLRELAQRPLGLLLALAGAWLPPVVVVAAWGWLAPLWLDPSAAAALVVGLALAGAMPVANSAVAWTHQSGGALAWALGLVVLSICLCPWATPVLLWAMGFALNEAMAARADELVSRFTGIVFVVWVLGPTLVGFATRRALGGERLDAARHVLALVSAAALLLLNYVNAAVSLPRVLAEPDWPLLATAVAAALSLPIACATPAARLATWAGLARAGRIAWVYSLGMKNTGLALGLIGATMGDQPVAVLAILAVTLMQHGVAGAAHALFARRPA
ncbi:bile acid:sodium symporter [Botrimarina sp.]|uniref:bile acid:sodium symporter n=1 Tax=Botrimarina sp. TaxID=2795802 RepID=UPI0032F07CA6